MQNIKAKFFGYRWSLLIAGHEEPHIRPDLAIQFQHARDVDSGGDQGNLHFEILGCLACSPKYEMYMRITWINT